MHSGGVIMMDASCGSGSDGMISFVIPAFNEDNGIAGVVEGLRGAMRRQGREYEILLVDDGSTDFTFHKAKKLERLHNGEVRVLSYSENRGKGFALRYGFEHSRGELVFFMDADGDLPPEQVGRFLRVMEESGADVVIGSKRHPGSVVENYPASRRVMSSAYYLLTKALFNLKVRDTQVGLKLFRREVLERVMPRVLVKRYAFDVELLANAVRRGYRVVEAPLRLRFNNDSRINWREIWWMFVDTMAVAYRMHVLRYYDR